MKPTTVTAPLLRGIGFNVADLLRVRAHAGALDLSTRRPMRNSNNIQQSHFRGRGMDYAESRPYLAGDDIRHMDWRATARKGRAHTKLYEEERGQTIWILVDFYAAMHFGTRIAFKSVAAAEAATIIGWAASAVGDRIGAVIVGEHLQRDIRPRASTKGVAHLVNTLVAVGNHCSDQPPHSATTIGIDQLLKRACKVVRPSTRIFAIGDFSRCNDVTKKHLMGLRRVGDLVCIWIYDAMEAEPPPPGNYPISDGRVTAMLNTTTAKARDHLRQRFKVAEQRMRSVCAGSGTTLIMVRSGDSIITSLRSGLGRRK